MTKIDVPCPKCEAKAGEGCRRVNGTGRVAMHKERLQAASQALGGTKPPKRRGNRVVKRFGAFLTMYGPKDAPTHAVLKLGHGPEPDTPRGFLLEMESHEQTERHARAHGIGTEWRMHFSGRPRIKLPALGAARRIYGGTWQPGASLPPLTCAGRKKLGPAQAVAVAGKLGQSPYLCEHCNQYHVKGKRNGHQGRID